MSNQQASDFEDIFFNGAAMFLTAAFVVMIVLNASI